MADQLPNRQQGWSRANEAKRIAAGGRRIPGGVLPPNASAALDKLQKSGYAESATACIARALVAAAHTADHSSPDTSASHCGAVR